jgi:hypothetical protein
MPYVSGIQACYDHITPSTTAIASFPASHRRHSEKQETFCWLPAPCSLPLYLIEPAALVYKQSMLSTVFYAIDECAFWRRFGLEKRCGTLKLLRGRVMAARWQGAQT